MNPDTPTPSSLPKLQRQHVESTQSVEVLLPMFPRLACAPVDKTHARRQKKNRCLLMYKGIHVSTVRNKALGNGM